MADKEGPQAPVPQGGQDPPALQIPLWLKIHRIPHFAQDAQNPPPLKNPFLPNAPQALAVPHMPPLKWSHFKTEYSGKPDKDAEAHLLRTNDWMDTHRFLDHIKLQRFCLNLSRGS